MRGKQARILEWIAIPFSRGSSWPGIKPRSPALQADSLPSEPPGKSKIQQNVFAVWLLLFWVFRAMELHLILFWTAHSFIPCDYHSESSSSLSPGLREDATFLIPSAFTCKPSLYKHMCGTVTLLFLLHYQEWRSLLLKINSSGFSLWPFLFSLGALNSFLTPFLSRFPFLWIPFLHWETCQCSNLSNNNNETLI